MPTRISTRDYHALVSKGVLPADQAPAGFRVDTAGRILIILNLAAVGKPRMTQRDRWSKRPAVVRYHEWCDALRSVAGQIPPASEVLELNWTAFFSPAESTSKSKRAAIIGSLHRQKPDRDNVDKAILDCLWKEDSGIAAGTIRKLWSESSWLEIEIVLATAN